MARLPMTIIRRSAITKRTRRRPAPKQTVVQRFAVHRSAVQQAKWSAGNRSIAERSITERSTAEWPVANSVVNPLACRTCRKRFQRKEHRVRHEKTHRHEKPFSCPHCDVKFGRKDTVNRHVRDIHEKRALAAAQEAAPKPMQCLPPRPIQRLPPGRSSAGSPGRCSAGPANVLGADQLQVHEAQSEDMPPEARQALEDFVASGCDYPLWPLQP
ncbi:hypothetical protein N7492_009284 [Penicillium capsulatum]|uniref:C2H2-type domain-containing protein n=1 Tax=Penicillium capsulatum TaxID=69766 RepID=A0A9W9HS93_9EURO|nr:hypothetical protein N7492_009284 [Penicillium capsulatum]